MIKLHYHFRIYETAAGDDVSLGYEAGAGGSAVKGGRHALDVLWGQPIRLAQVASTSELREKSMEGPSFL